MEFAKGVLLAALLLVILPWPRQPSSWQGPIGSAQSQGSFWQEDSDALVAEIDGMSLVRQELVAVDNLVDWQQALKNGDVAKQSQELLKIHLSQYAIGDASVVISYRTNNGFRALVFAAYEFEPFGSAYYVSNRIDTNKQPELRAVINSGERDQALPHDYYYESRLNSAAYGSKGGVWAYKAELAADSRNALAEEV